VKVGIPAAKRIFVQVCRDTITRCLKIEDQLQANLKPFYGPRTKWKRFKIRDLIEDKIRRNFAE
jgi:hypothetical protein